MLSLSVSWCPVGRLRHWCSSDIYAFHRYTGNSTYLCTTWASSFESNLWVEPIVFTSNLPSACALYTQ